MVTAILSWYKMSNTSQSAAEPPSSPISGVLAMNPSIPHIEIGAALDGISFSLCFSSWDFWLLQLTLNSQTWEVRALQHPDYLNFPMPEGSLAGGEHSCRTSQAPCHHWWAAGTHRPQLCAPLNNQCCQLGAVFKQFSSDLTNFVHAASELGLGHCSFLWSPLHLWSSLIIAVEMTEMFSCTRA